MMLMEYGAGTIAGFHLVYLFRVHVHVHVCYIHVAV